MTQPALTIAGRPMSQSDALEILIKYPRRTLRKYDFAASDNLNTITSGDVIRTRAVSSRISNVEMAWFVSRGSTAPWGAVPVDADLRLADPSVLDGEYTQMLSLYNHFRFAAPKGISVAKISKVLHLMRPGLYPILDSRITKSYSAAAAEEARRYSNLGHKRMLWAAIRSDLLANIESGSLPTLRAQLAAHDDAEITRLRELTDLRLLDILTW